MKLLYQKAEAYERASKERKFYEVAAVSTKRVAEPSKRGCFRCGKADHLANSNSCPARNATCRSCSKIGHFQKQCKTRKTSKCEEKISKNISSVSPVPEDITIFSVKTPSTTNAMKRDIKINGKNVTAIIDTGAAVNVIPYGLVSNCSLKPTTLRLKTWCSHPLDVIGETECEITYKDEVVYDSFIVVQTTERFPLLSTSLCKKLGMLQKIVGSAMLEVHDRYPDV